MSELNKKEKASNGSKKPKRNKDTEAEPSKEDEEELVQRMLDFQAKEAKIKEANKKKLQTKKEMIELLQKTGQKEIVSNGVRFRLESKPKNVSYKEAIGEVLMEDYEFTEQQIPDLHKKAKARQEQLKKQQEEHVEKLMIEPAEPADEKETSRKKRKRDVKENADDGDDDQEERDKTSRKAGAKPPKSSKGGKDAKRTGTSKKKPVGTKPDGEKKTKKRKVAMEELPPSLLPSVVVSETNDRSMPVRGLDLADEKSVDPNARADTAGATTSKGPEETKPLQELITTEEKERKIAEGSIAPH